MSAAPDGRKLHIGGTMSAEGWEIFNAVAGPDVDHVGDALDLSRFADASFVEVYASHVLEHFDFARTLVPALREWRRVLAPGGKLLLSVPDLDILARLFIARQQLDINERMMVMRMMFGAHADEHDFHKAGLNFEFMLRYLAEAGFRSAERVVDLERFEDTSRMKFLGVPISLNMIATK